jgi:putative two-component system response regulator
MAEVISATHHERFDGTGYPQGLLGGEIPLVGG